MERIALCANAKINLSLDIIGLREDGYHLMDMVMQSINLSDFVKITKTGGEFRIESNSAYLPTDQRNSAYKAARALADAAGRELFDCTVSIKKNIPSQAGLGGGTADAAAVLAGLNWLYRLGFSEPELLQIAPSIGADVPFCLAGGAARVGGIGDRIVRLPPLKSARFVIAMPWKGSSTRRAFELFDRQGGGQRPDVEAMERAVREDDTAAVARLCGNVFAPLVTTGEMRDIQARMLSCGALAASVTGSGAAVFGVFDSDSAAQKCRKGIAGIPRRCFVARPCGRGVFALPE